MIYDAIVVGGGIAGLTASAYLSKFYQYKTLLCEKEETIGGLVQSFERNGFIFDGGIRALENAGVLFPMLKQIGLEVNLVKNHISLGIEDQIIDIDSNNSVEEYKQLLVNLYPESKFEINKIIESINKIMRYMEIQYGIDNPLFLDIKKDRDYMIKEVVPWIFKYILTVHKINQVNKPVVDFLREFTQNQSLLDIIAQHFFTDTPAFFALSYFKLFLDYHYPIGGTGILTKKLTDLIQDNSGEIKLNTKIVSLDFDSRRLVDSNKNIFLFKQLIWAADINNFYKIIDFNSIHKKNLKNSLENKKITLSGKTGNNSVFTVYASVNKDKSFFANIASEHFFYTPSRIGQTKAGSIPINQSWEKIKIWLKEFLSLTTYEISIPVLRDSKLAPKGKTGLIISILFDFNLTEYIDKLGKYAEFKDYCEVCILETLSNTVYPGIIEAVIDRFSSTPLTIQRATGNTDGAITGWSFTNQPVPAESRLPKINNAAKTPIPGIFQAGQWTYSPSGFPVSIITGKLAADNLYIYSKKNKK